MLGEFLCLKVIGGAFWNDAPAHAREWSRLTMEDPTTDE
jgi:hypothetical protein